MVYVLTGTNWFGIKQRLGRLRAEFIEKNGELAVENIDGEEATFDMVKGALESLPFLSAQKMVITSRLNKNKAVAERIDELLKKASESTIFVLVEPEIDKRSVYYKTLKKQGGFEEYNVLDETETAKWLAEQAEERGGQLSFTDARLVIELSGVSQQKLAGELEKLLAYSKKITRENIKRLIDPTPQSSIFSLLDAAFAGDISKSLALYDDQRAQGIEPLNILGMMAWQLHGVALMQSAGGKSTVQVSQESGLKPFVLQKSSRIASRLDRSSLQKLIDDLLDLDIKFKTTAIDQDTALKNLLASLG